MKAIIYTKVGNAKDSLKISEMKKPEPKSNQLLVKVKASSITNMEYMRFGKMGKILNLAIHATGKPLGVEFSGIVEEVGAEVKTLKKGDEIFGLAKGYIGAWAEYVIASEKNVCLKPTSLSFEEASALVIGGITALGAVHAAKIQNGQKVLVQGASGSVGHLAVQLVKASGGVVTAVCSTRNVDMVKSLGADDIVDYKKENIATSNQTYDRIIAVNGYQPIAVYKKLLNKNGSYVLIGGTPKALSGMIIGPIRAIGSGKKFTSAAFPFQPVKQRLEELKQLAEEGKVKPYLDGVYAPNEAVAAIEYILREHAHGKVAFRMEF